MLHFDFLNSDITLTITRESTEVGMSRLALSDGDKQARDWFVETTKSLGCKTHIDKMGNIFAIRPGRREGPPTFAGSHLDTQVRSIKNPGLTLDDNYSIAYWWAI